MAKIYYENVNVKYYYMLCVCDDKFNDFSREMWPRHAWITKNNEGGLWIYLAGVSKGTDTGQNTIDIV